MSFLALSEQMMFFLFACGFPVLACGFPVLAASFCVLVVGVVVFALLSFGVTSSVGELAVPGNNSQSSSHSIATAKVVQQAWN